MLLPRPRSRPNERRKLTLDLDEKPGDPHAGEPIDTGADQKMGAGIVRGTEEFLDIVFTIPDMNEPVRIAEQRGRAPHVLEPADAFLGFDRHARRVDVTLQR